MQQAYNVLLKMRTTEVEVLDEVPPSFSCRTDGFYSFLKSILVSAGVLQGGDAALRRVGASCYGSEGLG